MKRSDIAILILRIPLTFGVGVFSFFIAREIRRFGDMIPGIALPPHTLGDISLLKFALVGSLLYLLVHAFRGGFRSDSSRELFGIVRWHMTSIMSWFFIFISLIYLGNEYLYTTDLPRLITLFATLCMVVGFITSDIVLLRLQEFLSRSGSLERTQLLILGAGFPSITQYFRSHPLYQISERSYARGLEEIRKGSIEEVLYFVDQKPEYLDTLIELCRIYGVRLRVVETRTERYGEHTEVGLLRGLPCVEIHFQSQKAWWRILKRGTDICLSFLGLILLSPVLVIIALLIKIEDPAGPVIYRNTRIGKDGKPFTLYKFRYMYWKYCVKDAYGVSPSQDTALKYEKELIASTKNTRSGPIYKITQKDPRKMKIARFTERYTLDELPQLVNVLLGNMSLVGPRPHQPREVEKYDEWHLQVLTAKPGMTGMAQVYAREAENFDREVELDRYYIEHWSYLLDLRLIVGTFGVLFNRNRS